MCESVCSVVGGEGNVAVPYTLVCPSLRPGVTKGRKKILTLTFYNLFLFMEAFMLVIYLPSNLSHSTSPFFVYFLIRAHRVSEQFLDIIHLCVSLELVFSNFSFQDML